MAAIIPFEASQPAVDPALARCLAQARAGDLDAFSELVRAHQDGLRAAIAARIPRADVVDDLAQETFVIAFRRLHSLGDPAAFPAWIRGIARNLVRAHLRRRREQQLGSVAELEQLVDAAEETELDGQALDQLRHCLDELTPEHRELLRLRYEDGLSVAELCRLGGRRHSSLTMVLHRLRERLRRCVQRGLGGAA